MLPLRLRLENFISHVDSELDFTKFDVALIVGAQKGNPQVSNGVGKSSIFVAIRWVLTGKSRFSTKDKIVKLGKSFCRVTFEFLSKNQLYKIIRTLDMKTNSINVNFYQKEGTVWEDLTCDTPTSTNKKIFETIKISDETLINSVCFNQNDISGFAASNNSQRKEILKEILQIGIWDLYQQQAKDTVKKFELHRTNIEERLKLIGNVDSRIDENINNINKFEKETNEINEAIVKINKEIDIQKQLVNKLEIFSLQDIEQLLEEKNIIQKNAAEIKNKISDLKNQIKKNNEIIVYSENDCRNLDNVLIKLATNVLKGQNNNKASCILSKTDIIFIPFDEEGFQNSKKELENRKLILNSLKKDFMDIQNIKLGEKCPICFSEINVEDLSAKHKVHIEFLKTRINEEVEIINNLEDKITNKVNIINESKNSLIEVERTELIIAKQMANRNNAEHKNEIIQIELKNLGMILKELKKKYDYLKIMIDPQNIKNFKIENEKYNKLLKTLDNLQKQLIEKSIKLGNLKGFREELERLNSEKQVLDLQFNNIIKEIKIYNNLQKAFGKDGIQAIIVENVTEDFKNFTNNILKVLCNQMYIDFSTQKQISSGWKEQFEIRIFINNNEFDFNDLSGGEQVRVSIALRLALGKLLMRRSGANIQFLLLDEVDQSLDKQGIDILAQTIHLLSRDFKILVITHNELMKEYFENIITIQKGVSGSFLTQ